MRLQKNRGFSSGTGVCCNLQLMNLYRALTTYVRVHRLFRYASSWATILLVTSFHSLIL